MKPFDLRQALAGKPVVHDDERGKFTPVTLTKLARRMEFAETYIAQAADGSSLGFFNVYGKSTPSRMYGKLVMASEKRTIWLNVFPSSKGFYCAYGFHSEDEAKADSSHTRSDAIAIPVEVEV
jgi:hypothetical protein